jgi:hypothetical protein
MMVVRTIIAEKVLIGQLFSPDKAPRQRVEKLTAYHF